MKKRILFIMPSMFIGGAERSILGLLEAIDYTQYDVTLFLYRHEGEFIQFIPKQVILLPEMDRKNIDVPISRCCSSEMLVWCGRDSFQSRDMITE